MYERLTPKQRRRQTILSGLALYAFWGVLILPPVLVILFGLLLGMEYLFSLLPPPPELTPQQKMENVWGGFALALAVIVPVVALLIVSEWRRQRGRR